MARKFVGLLILAPDNSPRVNDTKYSVAELWELARDLAKGHGRVVSYGVRINHEGRVSLVTAIVRNDGARDLLSMAL